jgi:hypothetical protein
MPFIPNPHKHVFWEISTKKFSKTSNHQKKNHFGLEKSSLKHQNKYSQNIIK